MLRLEATESIKAEVMKSCSRGLHQVPSWVLFGIVAICNFVLIAGQPVKAQDGSPPIVTTSILEVPSSDKEFKLQFTLYSGKNVQYFSAGVGIEERQAIYPGYPLKLIFVQGARAYLAEVKITIARADGTTLVDIPSEHVMGPWLFINLPSGTYTISATDSHQRVITKKVHVGGERIKVVHFRWAAR